MRQSLPGALILALLLTLALETGFFLIAGKRDKKDLLLVILVNILTNPAAALLYWLTTQYAWSYRAPVMAGLELFAILTEGYYYKKYAGSLARPFLFSAAANAFSFGIGELLRLFF